ncbi:hypothetical protein DFH94DRAFT_687075 [Russula ochroleuca]|uniref:Uncharacterized protein n=1 Tax=Russula ochroleuca TaxID=152965 RepID=A0A9P5MPL8_9AGAM|nr:hypothetical protein DFH94DRAFT_687075 [Russula ochroleuca]
MMGSMNSMIGAQWDQDSVSIQKYLWGLIACGAAGVCADFQYGIDIIIPFLYKDNVLGHRNVSALPLFIQSKNDKTFQAKPHFFKDDSDNSKDEDKDKDRELEEEDKDKDEDIDGDGDGEDSRDEDEATPIPVICMVFALASSTPCMTALKCFISLKHAKRTWPQREGSFKANFQADKYTSFDIWCGKVSHETFRQVKDNMVFQTLLLQTHIFPNIYQTKGSEEIQNVTRSMNPATDI